MPVNFHRVISKRDLNLKSFRSHFESKRKSTGANRMSSHFQISVVENSVVDIYSNRIRSLDTNDVFNNSTDCIE